MSKGSPRITLRLPEPLYSRVLATIERNNLHVKGEPWTMVSWIVDCCRDKIAHQDAARMQRERQKLQRRLQGRSRRPRNVV